jgi:hypothetical protein
MAQRIVISGKILLVKYTVSLEHSLSIEGGISIIGSGSCLHAPHSSVSATKKNQDVLIVFKQ